MTLSKGYKKHPESYQRSSCLYHRSHYASNRIRDPEGFLESACHRMIFLPTSYVSFDSSSKSWQGLYLSVVYELQHPRLK